MSDQAGGTHVPTVLVGVDGTPAGDGALAWALQEARILRATVESFVVWSIQIAKVAHVGFDELTESTARGAARRVARSSRRRRRDRRASPDAARAGLLRTGV